jgi:glycosyltransferase involved in cell wall biosynthesis
MQDLYAACDVVVCSSKREGTPYALLEAAWCGRPSVATPVGDVAWIVGDGGIVSDDLAGALVRFRDPTERDRAGRSAAESARRRFPAAEVAPSLVAFYRNLLR